ncbi:hypothetical protein BPAE_0010g00360 [Botrytis paeoniae]|uniref:Glucose-methanol-choline oxidoreductase N-terminal domain-containing protein n=1 Tax=Botrytis paeoniae TaxID=278948 RepID=A0A4Z1G3A0_9HELO|nr:hypothetical protein BPAE_0010g00360 [Botrytis paeoniae]
MSATPIPSGIPASYFASLQRSSDSEMKNDTEMNMYDFVIVGGGTSGLDPSIRVLVLEAGNDHSSSPTITTPGLWPANLGTETDWAFLSAPQKHLNGKQIPLSQGRLLGGSTAVNGGAFIANSRFSINTWGSLGNPSWSWDSLLPYYQKSFTLTLPPPETIENLSLSYIDPDLQRTFSGPLQASFSEEKDGLPKAWVDTWKHMGWGLSSDPFSGEAVGGYINAMNIDAATKTRSHALSAYYAPIATRENLVVATSALVTKILFSDSRDEKGDVLATGISYTKDSQSYTVSARKEVILAAGALQTPKLLELSGIGSAALLSDLDIPVIVDNGNVGENLQDHLNCGFSFEVEEGVKTMDALARQDSAAIGEAMGAYMTEKSGPFATGGNFAGGILPIVDFLRESGDDLEGLLKRYGTGDEDKTPFSKSHAEFVHSLLRTPTEGSGGYFSYAALGNFIPEAGSGDIIGKQNSSASSDTKDSADSPGNYLTIACMLLHPLSRGNTHITSSNPEIPPQIDPKYLSHPLDLEILSRHVRYISKIISSPPLSTLLKPSGRRNHGAPSDITDLDAIKEYVKKAALSAWHPTSTCAMLPLEKGGVVSEKLLVYGTKNLRIVDASIFPLSTRGNCQTTVYAVAEKAADLIREDHGIKV